MKPGVVRSRAIPARICARDRPAARAHPSASRSAMAFPRPASGASIDPSSCGRRSPRHVRTVPSGNGSWAVQAERVTQTTPGRLTEAASVSSTTAAVPPAFTCWASRPCSSIASRPDTGRGITRPPLVHPSSSSCATSWPAARSSCARIATTFEACRRVPSPAEVDERIPKRASRPAGWPWSTAAASA